MCWWRLHRLWIVIHILSSYLLVSILSLLCNWNYTRRNKSFVFESNHRWIWRLWRIYRKSCHSSFPFSLLAIDPKTSTTTIMSTRPQNEKDSSTHLTNTCTSTYIVQADPWRRKCDSWQLGTPSSSLRRWKPWELPGFPHFFRPLVIKGHTNRGLWPDHINTKLSYEAMVIKWNKVMLLFFMIHLLDCCPFNILVFYNIIPGVFF